MTKFHWTRAVGLSLIASTIQTALRPVWPRACRGSVWALLIVFCCCGVWPRSAIAQQKATSTKADPQKGTAAPAAKDSPAKESSAEAIQQYRLAVPLQNKGNYDFAVEEWEKFLTLFPNDPLAPKARYYSAICHQQLKQHDQARAAYEMLLKVEPQFDQLESVYANLGVALLAQARAAQPAKQQPLLARADEVFAELLVKYPQGTKAAEARFNRADALYLADKKPAAVALWKELLAKNADSLLRAEALYNIGVTQQELKQPQEAGATFDDYLKQYPKEKQATEVSLRRGLTLYEQQKYAAAEQRFAVVAAAKNFPQADFALLRQGDALLALNKPAEAATVYAKLARDFPKSEFNAEAILQAGKAFHLAGKAAAARQWLATLTADPANKLAGDAAHWLARSYLKDNQPAEVIKTIDAILPKITVPAQQAELQLDRAEALYQSPDNKKDALAAYTAFADKFPDSPQLATALYMSGQTAMELRDFAAGTKLSERFLQRFPQHELLPYVLFVAAECALLSDDPAKADALYAQLLEKHAQHAEVPFWKLRRGWTFLKQKNYDRAVEHYTALLKDLKKPEQLAEAQALLGTALLESQKPAEAIKALNASLAAQPTGHTAEEALLNLARAQRANKDPDAAKVTLSKLLKDFPQTAQADRARYRLGELLHTGGDYKAALGEFAWIVKNAPNSPLLADALLGMATASAALQDYPAAQKLYTELLQKPAPAPILPRAYFGRAGVRIQQQEYAPAAADLKQFLDLNPAAAERSEARYLLGYAQAADKKYDAAIATLGTLLKDDPQYAAADKALYELAWAQQTARKADAAQATFARLAKDFPASPHAAESWFNVGEFAYQEQKDYAAAAKAYTQALQAGGAANVSELALHKLGWARYQQNDFAGAAQAFADQTSKYGQGKWAADGTFMSGECLFKQNQFDPALAALEKAVALPVSSPVYKELALLHAAQSATQLKKWETALKLAERFAADFAASAYLPEAIYEQAWSQQNLKKLDEARKLYDLAAVAAVKEGKGEIAARARFMNGEILFEIGQHKEAVKQFYAVAYTDEKKYPTWQANALYEAARCFEVLKNVESAKKSYAELVATYPESDKVEPAKKRLDALK